MIIHPHGSLGDQIMLTGLPEAYYKLFGELTFVEGGREDLWKYNPYITKERFGKEFSYSFNSYPKDYMIYYPIRVFYDLTGVICSRNFVHPNLYWPSVKNNNCVVNDQAGWPSRTGYKYLDDLIKDIKKEGFHITYVRNENFRDCFGNCPKKQLTIFDTVLTDMSLSDMITTISNAALYVGYNSGLSQIAGATNTKYVLLDGPVPPINTAHNSCIFATDMLSCRRCVLEDCINNCLQNSENFNDSILDVIRSLK